MLDPHSLPIQPVHAIAVGDGHPVDLLVGSTSDEANLYLAPTGALRGVAEADIDALARRFHLSPTQLAAAYRRDPADGLPEILSRATTDALFGAATRHLRDAHAAYGRGKTYSYEFTWRSNAFDGTLGACHCLDLPWIFGTTDLPAISGPHALLGAHRPDPWRAQRIHQAWLGFIRDGDPAGQNTAQRHRIAPPSRETAGCRRNGIRVGVPALA